MGFNAWRQVGTTRIRSSDYRLGLDDDFGAILREQLLPAGGGATEIAATDTASLSAQDVAELFKDIAATDGASLSGLDVAEIFALLPASDAASLSVSESVSVEAIDSATPQETFSSGFFYWYELERQRARKRRRELEEAEEEAREIQDALDREIAQRLQKLEREEAERQEFKRLADLAARYVAQQAQDEFSDRVLKAVIRANATQSAAALAQLRFEIERQLEEEEMALLLILNQ